VLIGLGVIIVCRGADQDSAIRVVDVLLDAINDIVNLWDSCSANLLEPNEESQTCDSRNTNVLNMFRVNVCKFSI
jgi:hypothetical protein